MNNVIPLDAYRSGRQQEREREQAIEDAIVGLIEARTQWLIALHESLELIGEQGCSESGGD